MTAFRYLVLLAVVTVFALLGTAQRTRALLLGYRLESLQMERALLADQNRQLLCEISAQSQPARIAGAVARADIALMDPVALTQAPGGGAQRTATGRAHRGP